MNDWIMKLDYIRPETLIIRMDGENGIVCASDRSIIGNPGIDNRDTEED